MKSKIILALIAFSLSQLTLANNAENSIKRKTIKVFKITDFDENGDGYSVIDSNHHSYFLYTNGGENPIKGETLLKKNKIVCLTYEDGHGYGDVVLSVKNGKC